MGDFLTEDKICEMFKEDIESCPKKQEVSLNFTVTSRESRTCFPMIGSAGSKTNAELDRNCQHQLYNNKFSSNITNPEISSAEKELKRFNKWMQDFNKENEKILEELNILNSIAQNNRPQVLDNIDIGYLRKVCSKNAKNNSHGSVKNGSHQGQKQCMSCKKKDEIIQIIRQDFDAKIQQCKQYEQKHKKLEMEHEKQLKYQLRNKLLDGVEFHLMNEEKQALNEQISNLKGEIEKFKMERSLLLQKSNSFLKTKDIGYTNSKLFSNAKYSTNALNPNDTMNRVDSLICFGQTEPNLDELIRFYGQEIQVMKSRYKQLIMQQQKISNKKFTKETRNFSIRDRAQCRLLECYKNIKLNLLEIKSYKEKQSYLFTGSIKQRKMQEEDHTFSIQCENEELKRTIADLERKIRCIENQKNNLIETNVDLVGNLSKQINKLKQLEDEIKKKDETLKRYECNLKSAKCQYAILYQKFRSISVQKKKVVIELQQMKGLNRVYCRVRPRMGSQLKSKLAITYSQDNKIRKDGRQYEFNYVFSDQATQIDVFNQVKGLVECAFDGKNLCIFGYGQTGSGKTHTLHGTEPDPGLGPNIIQLLYQQKSRMMSQSIEVVFVVKIAEIYKEQMLSFNQQTGNILQIKDHMKGGEDVKSIRVSSKEQMIDLYHSSITNRNNFQSEIGFDPNRSHWIFTIIVEHHKRNPKDKEKIIIKSSKICLVDLANAERGNSNPLTSKEVQAANKGFSSLISVFTALKNKSEISHKDSRLTYYLRQFLNPYSMIVTFINISPSEHCSIDTTNSLVFGYKVRGLDKQMYSKSKDTKENKENEKNRRSSTRLSIS